MADSSVRALTFDVFGTVVDWRGSIIDEGHRLWGEKRLNLDWAAFADAWRERYQPSMSEVRDGRRPWTVLDQLHRESLTKIAPHFGLDGLSDVELDDLNLIWHRLKPWPDSVTGLTQLKQTYTIAALSNGNLALLTNMAKRAELPWDAILGAEVTHNYKPLPAAYLGSARALGLTPAQCMMVAAHNSDLAAARRCGFKTAFVRRPREYGPMQTTDLHPTEDWDIVANDLIDLAERMDR